MGHQLDPRLVMSHYCSKHLQGDDIEDLVHIMQNKADGTRLLTNEEVIGLVNAGPQALIRLMRILHSKMDDQAAFCFLLASLNVIGRQDLMAEAERRGCHQNSTGTVRRHGVLTLRADLDRTPIHGVVYYPTADPPPEFDPDMTAVKQVYSPTDDQTAGAVADQTAGAVADQTAGAVADQTAGAVADQIAGAVADQTAGAVANPTSVNEVSDPTENHPLESDDTAVKVFYTPTEAESSDPVEDLIPVDDTDDAMDDATPSSRLSIPVDPDME